MFVLKKDNKTKECFQEHKIRHAIEKAYNSLNREFDETLFKETLIVLGVDDSDTSESVISVYDFLNYILNFIYTNDRFTRITVIYTKNYQGFFK